MTTTTKKTTIEYPVSEFIELLMDQIGMNSSDVSVRFIIQEVGGDYLDRYPGQPQVVAVEICYEEKSQ